MMMQVADSPSLSAIRDAQLRINGVAIRSPLVRCPAGPPDKQISLKLENLQAIGSFKVRPIANVMLSHTPSALATGVYTSSSGNSGLALSWMARRLGIAASVLVGENAPEVKLARLKVLGARVVKLSVDEWWQSVETCGHPTETGLYIDAVRDPAALAGGGTVALEILEQMPDVEAILVPFGGGGLACGTACAVRALRPDVKVIACELQSAQPLSAALHAGRIVTTPCEAGFVSGVGFGSVLPEMWPMLNRMVDGTITVSLEEVAGAIKVLAERNKVIAEGAGALTVAAAFTGRYPHSRVCAVVSGGNIGNDVLTTILAGKTPG
jgi:threonine dehydratase